jgi:hypothetical protein
MIRSLHSSRTCTDLSRFQGLLQRAVVTSRATTRITSPLEPIKCNCCVMDTWWILSTPLLPLALCQRGKEDYSGDVLLHRQQYGHLVAFPMFRHAEVNTRIPYSFLRQITLLSRDTSSGGFATLSLTSILVPRLRMRGVIPPSPYVFMAWCLVKQEIRFRGVVLS